MKLKTKYILFAIVLIGFLVRVYRLSEIPPSLSWDEISHGYNAYSILKTGRDEWGELPFANFRAYGDYPTTFYLYVLIPVIALFGLNEFSIRLPSVIFGTLLILAIYLLSETILKSPKKALIPAILASLSPWLILPSRQTIQVVPATFLITISIWLWLKNNFKAQVLATICLGLSAYGYHNTRILAPIFFVILVLSSWRIFLKNRLKSISLLLVACFFFVPLVPVLLSSEGSARATWVGILDQGAINQINQSRTESSLPGVFPKLINNKLTYFSKTTIVNYLGYFSPVFLILEGGTHYQFSIPHFGLIHPIELPFFYLGLLAVLILCGLQIARLKAINDDSKPKLLMLIFLLLSPLPAAITRDPYQVVRGFVTAPFIYIFIGLGFWFFVDFVSSKKRLLANGFVIFFIAGIAFLSVYYLDNLLNVYPKQYSFAWQYGYKQAVSYILAHQGNFAKIYITKKYAEPHEFLLFYSQFNPNTYQSDPNLIRYKRSDWYWVDAFNKYEFINDWEIKDKLVEKKGSLLITSPDNYPKGSNVLESINFLDGSRAFDIVVI